MLVLQLNGTSRPKLGSEQGGPQVKVLDAKLQEPGPRPTRRLLQIDLSHPHLCHGTRGYKQVTDKRSKNGGNSSIPSVSFHTATEQSSEKPTTHPEVYQ